MNEYSKIIKMFWFVFLFATFIYIFIAYNASPEVVFQFVRLQDIEFILKFLGVLILPLIGVVFLEKYKHKLVEVNQTYLVVFLVQLALAESVSVIGISFFFVSKIFVEMLPFSVATFIIVLYLKPKDRAI